MVLFKLIRKTFRSQNQQRRSSGSCGNNTQSGQLGQEEKDQAGTTIQGSKTEATSYSSLGFSKDQGRHVL